MLGSDLANFKLTPRALNMFDKKANDFLIRDLTKLTDFLTFSLFSKEEDSLERSDSEIGNPFSLEEIDMNKAKGNIQMQMPKKDAISVKDG